MNSTRRHIFISLLKKPLFFSVFILSRGLKKQNHCGVQSASIRMKYDAFSGLSLES